MKNIKRITVIINGSAVESETYPKRAQQLVKKGRAYWVDADTICVTEVREDINMKEQEKILDIQQSREKEKVLDLATRKVEERNRLIINALDIVLLAAILVWMVVLWGHEEKAVVAGVYGVFIIVRLIRKIWLYNKGSSTKSIKDYLRDRKEREIRIVYEKMLEVNSLQEEI